MVDTYKLGGKLKELGFDFYSGVPCSSLMNLINFAINDCEYVMAANEGDALAISAGAYLGGRKSVVLFQNSGLTNATSPLTSLNFCFQIPVLGFTSLRGEVGTKDEPQHELMGQITTEMLDTMRIKWAFLADNTEEMAVQLEEANRYIENSESFFFVVKKGTLDSVPLNPQNLNISENEQKITASKESSKPSRREALNVIHSIKDDDTLFYATTGKTGRELYEVDDCDNNLYMVGSMGCVSSLGLGTALVKNNKKVVAIDGDGALLMRLGSLTTNAYYKPENLLHILLDNNTHDSTGGQFTVSHNVNFVEIAASSGYPTALFAHDLDEFDRYIQDWKKSPTLTFIHLKTEKGSPKELARPTVKPFEVKQRLMNLINK